MTRIDQSAHETPLSSQAPSWASGSLAVVLPVRGAPTQSRRIGPDNLLWTLRSSAKAAPRGGPSIVIGDKQLAAMRSDVGYLAVHGRELRENQALADALPEAEGCLVRAVEVFTYADTELMSYVVLHIVLTAPALEEIAARTTWFLDPPRSEQALRNWSNLDRHALLRSLGFGPTSKRRSQDIRPFVVTHLVPGGRSLPRLLPTEVPDDTRDKAPEHQWAQRLASGSTRIVSLTPGAPRHAPGYWLGSSWCLASSTGLALVGTRGVLEDRTATDPSDRTDERLCTGADLEPAVVEGFAHHEAVDLVILAMRQSAFLAHHADDLVNAWDIELDSAPTTLDSVLHTSRAMRERALRLEERLSGFRRDLWLDFTDADEAVHQAVTSVQRALGLPRRLREVESEQLAISEALLGSADHISRRVAEHYGGLPTEKSLSAPLRTHVVDSVLFVVVALGMTHAASQALRGDTGPTPYFWVALLLIAGTFLGMWAVSRIVDWCAGQRGG